VKPWVNVAKKGSAVGATPHVGLAVVGFPLQAVARATKNTAVWFTLAGGHVARFLAQATLMPSICYIQPRPLDGA